MMKQALITAESLILAFFLAVSKEDFGECQSLIQQGVYVDGRDEKGNSALIKVASSPKRIKLTRMLLKAGAGVNITNVLGDTALFAASRAGNEMAVKLFLKHGADPNARNVRSVTALMQAAEEGHLHIVKALVDAGAEVNVADNHGETALMMATFTGHREVVDALLSAGACPLASTPYGWTALRIAEECNHPEIANTLRMACELGEEVATGLVYEPHDALPLVA